MVNFSRKHLDEAIKRAGWQNFVRQLKNQKSEQGIKDLLNNFLSPSERIVFEKRLLIVYLLSRGWTYTRIANMLDVSRSTISFIKKEFKRSKRRQISARKTGLSMPAKKFRRRFPPITGKGRGSFLNTNL